MILQKDVLFIGSHQFSDILTSAEGQQINLTQILCLLILQDLLRKSQKWHHWQLSTQGWGSSAASCPLAFQGPGAS